MLWLRGFAGFARWVAGGAQFVGVIRGGVYFGNTSDGWYVDGSFFGDLYSSKNVDLFCLAIGSAGLTIAPLGDSELCSLRTFDSDKIEFGFELYQSQCLETEGLLGEFTGHPSCSSNSEGQEYG